MTDVRRAKRAGGRGISCALPTWLSLLFVTAALMCAKPADRRYFESALNSYALGYQETDLPNTLVVFMYDEPACEIISHGHSYSELLTAFKDWRAGAGARFVSTTGFEPVSRVTMDRAVAAAFLAAPRRDGRVTEITLNWNLTFEGLTRLRVSYQPLRDHTADLMGVAVK